MNAFGWRETRHGCLSAVLTAIALLSPGTYMASADPEVHTTAVGPSLPSERCERREEWQQTCLVTSGRPRDRYLTVGRIRPKDGVGASLRLIGSAIDMALSFDLELRFTGPFLASHGVGDWGSWFGLVGNDTSPMLELSSPQGYLEAAKEDVQKRTYTRGEWLHSQENRTSVAFVPDMMKIGVIDWGAPAIPSPSRYDDRVCTYARQVLRQIYWGRTKERDLCQSLLPSNTAPGAGNGSIEGITFWPDGENNSSSRPWVVGVHVRRGDVRNKKRIVPHSFFVEAVRSVLYGIAEVHRLSDKPTTCAVTIVIFSEGKTGMTGLDILDEHHKIVTWDIAGDSCEELGLHCHQEIFLDTTLYDTFECLAAVDVFVGSMSTMSEVIAAVSSNVKVIPQWKDIFPRGDDMQDRVGLDAFEVGTSGSVSPEKQAEIFHALSDWQHCFGEALKSTADGDARGVAATRFYETIAV